MSSFVVRQAVGLLAVMVAWVATGSLATAQPASAAKSPSSSSSSSSPTSVTALSESDFRKELERLDTVCAKLNLADERNLMTLWQVSDASDAHLLFLPVAADPLDVPASSPSAAAHASWLRHFGTARTRHAQHWYEVAQQQASSGDEWAAYRSLWRAAREDSSHAETKRALGTLLGALNVKGKPRPVATVHPQFQWPSGSYSRMETTNFKITSRADAAQTQRLAAQLETFYALWTQSFYPLWAPPGITAQRLTGRNTNWQRKQQVDVVLCKDRADYIKTLGVAESNIGISVGYYNPEAQMSFFYPDESLPATLHHELTHQLLAEASQLKGTRQTGEQTHFWLIEAVALYMESLIEEPYHYRLGGWLAPRMQGARYRAVHDGYWLDPTELDDITFSGWKEREDIARLYTHSAGLAHFFMDRRLARTDVELSSADGASGADADARSAMAAEQRLDSFDADAARAAFFSALIAVYRGDSFPEQFWQVVGAGDAQQDYLHFQLVRDRHVASLSRSRVSQQAVEELVLTRSRLTPASWQAIGQFKRLQWLDVANSNAQSKDLQWLNEMTSLERLSLEGVDVDRELIVAASRLPKLKELDLSNCQVDDDVLLPLQQCAQLETLWLSGTKVSIASLKWIEKLPKLKFVALDQTSVSATEATALNAKLKKR